MTASLHKVKENPANRKDTDARFEDLKQKILQLGYVRPGSLVRRFMPCGNPGCKCMGTPPKLHGPYYQWTFRINGKTRTVRLTREQAQLCQKWTNNHRLLRGLVRKMEQISLKKTDRALGAISRS
jgi:hypothetical protein